MIEDDPQTVEAKLQPCVKWLVEAGRCWEANGLQDAPIVIGCASPRASQFLRADGWPEIADDVYAREAVAEAVIAAVDSPISDLTCSTILAGISLLLGPQGRAEHLKNVAGIRQQNKIPLLIVMLADVDTIASTVTGLDRPTLH